MPNHTTNGKAKTGEIGTTGGEWGYENNCYQVELLGGNGAVGSLFPPNKKQPTGSSTLGFTTSGIGN